jgi:hypothetical protein
MMQEISSCVRARWIAAVSGAVLSLGLSDQVASQTSPRETRSYSPFARGLLARSITEIPMRNAPGIEVELWDLLVGPGMITDALILPGAGILQVRSGAAKLAVEQGSQDIRLGQTIPIHEGQNLRIDNSGSSNALILRATLIRTR